MTSIARYETYRGWALWAALPLWVFSAIFNLLIGNWTAVVPSAGAAFATLAAISYRADSRHRNHRRDQAAYDQGWWDRCQDHLDQKRDPDHPIGERKQTPYVPTERP